jgi:sugar lactone lactonase YvrE
MYALGGTNKTVFQYSLSTAYDASTASYDSVSFSVAVQITTPYGMTFSSDGSKMYIVSLSGDAVYQYTLSTNFDLSTASYLQNFSVAAQDSNPIGIAFSTDGTKMFVVGNTGRDVNEYTLSTGFDVSTASFVDSFSVSAQESSPHGITFNTDGTKMFVAGIAGDDVNEYTLSTGFDVSTASFVDSFSVASQDVTPRDVVFNNTGSKMFVLGAGNRS